MLHVKSSEAVGCLYLGKGFVDHPEMGVVVECREVVFDEWDFGRGWKGDEHTITMVRTDTGFAFDEQDLWDGKYEIELHADNWRARKPDAWGIER